MSRMQSRAKASSSNLGGTSRVQSKTNQSKAIASSSRASTSKAGAKPSGAKPSGAKPSTSKANADTTEKKEEVYKLPAFSIPYKPKTKSAADIDKIKKRTIRRNSPEGEDLKQIKKIISGLKGQDVTVQEFITLVGPYTADNGACLRQVLQEDLTAFRKLARKVYETMTQDVSDVLLNEQVDLSQYYHERKTQFQAKIMKAINEIFEMIPNFDFDTFDKDQLEYLKKHLPIPASLGEDEEELAVQRRQEAYHRLQWLRSEGERLNDENTRLQERLANLKRMQQDEHVKALEREEASARKREELEVAEAEMKDQLEKLSESMEKTLIEQETDLRLAQDKPPPRGAIKKKPSKTETKRKGRQPPRAQWNQQTAVEIEETQKDKVLQPEVDKTMASATGRQSRSRTSVRGQRGAAAGSRKKSPFQFSPIKSPPPKAARELSPFHYSPPKLPVTGSDSQDGGSDLSEGEPAPKVITSTRAETTSKVTEARQLPQPRKSQAPRDSWAGFR